MKETITIERTCWGQPRPYADSLYAGYISFEEDGKPRYIAEDWAKQIAKAVFKNWVEKDDPKYSWASPTLTRFEGQGEGRFGYSKYLIEVREAYTD